MDFETGLTVDFRGGLDIQGKLIFPEPINPRYKLRVRAPGIVVQGELEMLATKPVDGRENYRFAMIEDEGFFFTPADNNSGMCRGNCTGGKRSITVAGGKLNCKCYVFWPAASS